MGVGETVFPEANAVALDPCPLPKDPRPDPRGRVLWVFRSQPCLKVPYPRPAG